MTRNAANATGLGSLVLAALCCLAAAWVFHAGPRQSGGLYVSGAQTVASAQR
ncbi:hypothetical protein [Alkalicaulis satelles]|uniref:hypothetical protein n=1 Tax=Alkalicaulis satelles TaxID=2609175 RepID=UPI0018EAB8E8|nr:hypothetical protein [Alkalicaulis satelles]